MKEKTLDNINCLMYNVFRHLSAGVAQLVEQLICNQQVVGSSPIASSNYGWMPEWLKGADCKSAGSRLRRFKSYPRNHVFYTNIRLNIFADIAQSVERILGKDKVTSSILVISSIGGIAQLARASGSYPLCPEFKSLYRHQHKILTRKGLFLCFFMYHS